MKTVPVRLVKTLDQSYVIRIGRSIFERELTNVVGEISPTGVAVVLDSNLERLYAKRVEKLLQAFGIPARLISFPAGEKNKHLGTVTKLFTKLARSGLDRRTLIVALGGGVTGDIAGFLASLALRGIPFVQVPTSLLAMTDSSIGGKTGVDTPEGKNLIGAFYQPKAVIIDTEFLDTLPEREYINGMAEVVKHGLIADAAYFDKLEESADRILGRDYDWMTEIIARSCEIKARVVENDERETGLRQTLNFGTPSVTPSRTLRTFAYPTVTPWPWGWLRKCPLPWSGDCWTRRRETVRSACSNGWGCSVTGAKSPGWIPGNFPAQPGWTKRT